MKKKMIVLVLCWMAFRLASCSLGNKKENSLQSDSDSAVEQADKKSEGISDEQSGNKTNVLTQEQALEAIKKYCFIKNPELERMVDSDQYTLYWDVSTNEEEEIVVLYRSYTGAVTRYYIDPVSGEAYSTELVPGIIEDEQRTDEKLNVRDYLY